MPHQALDLDHLREWVGRTEELHDRVTAAPLRALTATLDRDDAPQAPGTPVPPLWHWLYFLPTAPQSELGPDGHPQRGGFLPPVPLPRRMWAGGQLRFHRPLRVGQPIVRRSHINDVRLKEGRSGSLVFVNVDHRIEADGELAIEERHDIVYRDMPAPGEGPPAPVTAATEPAWSRRLAPDDVLLFRYSALTFNGHRIHYDRRYVTEVEGYPGLVVHGPLIATLLLDLLRRHLPDADVREFSFRAMKPTFDTAAFEVCGAPQDDRSVHLWARDAEGHLTMDARASLA